MKRCIVLLVCFVFFVGFASAQGTIKVDHITASTLKNEAGENPTRRVTVYLPPGYDQGSKRYPVIYFLHGFTWSDSLMIAVNHFDKLLDRAIESGAIKPVIVVMPNEYTLYRGSFYTNSSYTGNWADFTAKELVEYVDKNYRTIADRESRGIAGHSMGGHGAIKLSMLYPDQFSSVYALSPAALDLQEDLGKDSDAYKRVTQIKNRKKLTTGYDEFLPNAVVALGQAFSPNPKKKPFFVDLPFSYQGDTLIVDLDVLQLWNKNLPLKMVEKNEQNLRKLKAIKLDWGRNDESPHIPKTCLAFSKKLEGLEIKHYAEEYLGTHTDMIFSDDGRIATELLPFFNTLLKFE